METILCTSQKTEDVSVQEAPQVPEPKTPSEKLTTLRAQLASYTKERDAVEKEIKVLMGAQDALLTDGQSIDDNLHQCDKLFAKRTRFEKTMDRIRDDLIPQAENTVDGIKAAAEQDGIDNMLYRRQEAASKIEALLDQVEAIMHDYENINLNAGVRNPGAKRYHPFGILRMTEYLRKILKVRTGHKQPGIRKDEVVG